MQVQAYVFFEGRCEEAIELYKTVLGAKVEMLMRFKDAPPSPQGQGGCCVRKTRKRHAVQKMKEDPSEPPSRGRLQTAISCFGQKPRW